MSITKANVERALRAIEKAKEAVSGLTLGNPKKNRADVLRYLGYAETNLKLAGLAVSDAVEAKGGKRD